MSLIESLQHILKEAKADCDLAVEETFEMVSFPISEQGENRLVQGDNLAYMKALLREGMGGKIKLIYIDPPFFSKANYDAQIRIESSLLPDLPAIRLHAYHDLWEDGLSGYLRMLASRFYLMRELLSENGSIFIHLDWHVVHYAKVLLDEIFGEKNFVNEIIWHYKSGGTSKRHFSRKHDTLLFYAKTAHYTFHPQLEKSYNREYKPYRFKGVKEYKDDLGWYTMVNMKDVWMLDMVGRTSGERTGYATQKPEALLRRIIESCTDENDLCADFFGGSGSLAAAAEKAGRKWISCDIGALAFTGTEKRMTRLGSDFVSFRQNSIPNSAKGVPEAEVTVSPMELSDNTILRITLLSYSLDAEELPLDPRDKAVVETVLEKDSLSLIDCWSVDFHYDGKVHRPEMLFTREKSGCADRCENTGKAFQRINLRVSDIFGNSAEKTIEI